MNVPQRFIDDELISTFERDGYLVARAACPPDRVERMRRAAQEDLRRRQGPLELESELGYPGAPASDASGGDTVRRLLDATGRNPAFGQWAASEALTGRVRALLGSREIRIVQAHHNCIMTKQPAFSSATGWHQDIRYWSFERPDLVNAWTALGRESADNGGMRLIPGSHRAVLDSERFDSERFFRDDHPPNRSWIERAVQVDLNPGDVLLFHAALLHSAGRNLTGERKLSVVFSYRSVDNRPRPGTRSASRTDLDPASRVDSTIDTTIDTTSESTSESPAGPAVDQ